MAEVYDFVDGEEIQRVVARHKSVQARLDKEAMKAALKAERRLARHHDTGNAFIDMSEGDIDRYVELHDPDSFGWDEDDGIVHKPPAALAIEMRLNILGKATGLRG